MKLIQTLSNASGSVKAKVYRDSENDVYLVRLFVDGVENVDASYETDDLQDARGTAHHMVYN